MSGLYQIGAQITLDGAAKVDADLRKVSSSFAQTGVSAAQTAAAMRQVPAQFTDIVTSLQAGQAPLTVLLQQGGQLKDAFGGVGNAARAMGTYVSSLATPINLTAAAVAAVGVAAYQGAQEMATWRNAMIASGNSIGATVQQYQAVADSMDNVAGITKGSATQALVTFASTGKVASANLESFATSAIQWSRETGESISDIAKNFADLAKEPLSATIKLNEGMNFLTLSVYQQIKALEDQGKTVEAANLAQRTYADTLGSRAAEMEKNIGTIERSWRNVKAATLDAWDALKSLGRESTFGEKALPLMDRIGGLEQMKSFGVFWNEQREKSLQLAKAELAELEKQFSATQKAAAADAARRAQVEARIQADKDGLKYLSDELKMRREIAQQLETLNAAGATKEEKDKREADIRASYNKKGPAAPKEANPFAADQEAAKEWAKYVQEFSKAAADATAKTEGLTKSQATLVEFLQSPGYANMPESARQLALEKAYAAIAAEKQAEAEKVLAAQAKEAAKAFEDSYQAITKRTETLTAEVEKQREANQAIGLGAVALASLEAARLEEQAAAAERRAALADEIDWSGKLGDAYRDQAAALRELAQVKVSGAAAKSIADSAKSAADEWRRTAESIERSITDGLMRGFESGKSFAVNLRDTLVNMFKTLVLRPVISFIVNPIAGAINAVFGGSSAAGSLGNAASLASGGMSLGNYVGTGLANATGTGIDGLLAANGAYGTAGGIGSVVTTAMPYIAAAFAAYGLLSSLNGGETRTGGQYAVAYDGQVTNNRRGESYQYVGQQFNRDNSNGVRVTNGQAYLIEADGMGTSKVQVDGKTVTAEEATRLAVSNTATSIQETLKALGSKMTLNGFWAGMETSGKGRGGVFSGGSFGNGTSFGESGKGDNYSGTLYELTSTNSPDAATALANFTLDLKQVTIEALQAASDIPKTIGDKLKGVDAEALTSDAADTLLSWVSTQISNVNALATVANSLPLQNLKNLSFDAASGLIELAGGLDALTGQLNDYYTTYYSPEEQAANTLSNIKKSLEAVGLELPTSEQAFRALVEAQDQSTESGRKAFLALISVSKAFAAVTPSAEEAAAAIDAAAAKQAASAQQAALTALDSAYAALEASIAAQRTALQETAQAAQDAVSTIASIYQTLKQNVDELYNSVATTQAQGQRAALQFIDTTLAQARASGKLPDGTSLSDAISAARTGLGDASAYASRFEQQRAQLILAGKLAELQSIAGVQKTVAEQQLDAANAQIDKLDKTLDYWKTQVEIAKGTYKATLSITDAIKDLTKAILGVKDPATPTSGTQGGTDSSGFSAGPGSGTTFTLTGRDAENSALRQYWEKTFNLGKKDATLHQIYTDSKAYGITQKRWAEVLGVNVQDMAELFGSVQIPAFAVGTNYVPSDMLAMIHQGEAIVPKAYNPAAGGVLQSDGQVARLLTALITEVQALRSSGDRTANALEGNQSSPLIVEVVNRVLNVKGTTA